MKKSLTTIIQRPNQDISHSRKKVSTNSSQRLLLSVAILGFSLFRFSSSSKIGTAQNKVICLFLHVYVSHHILTALIDWSGMSK